MTNAEPGLDAPYRPPAGGVPVSSTATGEPEPTAIRDTRYAVSDWLKLVRPAQWVKNFWVLAALLFSGKAAIGHAWLDTLGAFVMFCLLASGIYVGNDIVDRAADRMHPVKRKRPVASGRIPVRGAAVLGLALVLLANAIAWGMQPKLGAIALGYLVLNLLYTFRLKEMVIVDVFCIAAFFIMRLMAGAVAISVKPSVWLLLCGGLLALYLGFTKRRHELTLLGEGSAAHRSVLTHYSTAFLDQMAGVLLSVTVVSYIMYALTSDTAKAKGPEALAYSTGFVLYGVFRYLYLVHKREGGSPTQTLLTDWPLMVNAALWLLYCGWVVYRPV